MRVGAVTLTFQGHMTSSVTISHSLGHFLFASSDSFSVRSTV